MSGFHRPGKLFLWDEECMVMQEGLDGTAALESIGAQPGPADSSLKSGESSGIDPKLDPAQLAILQLLQSWCFIGDQQNQLPRSTAPGVSGAALEPASLGPAAAAAAGASPAPGTSQPLGGLSQDFLALKAACELQGLLGSNALGLLKPLGNSPCSSSCSFSANTTCSDQTTLAPALPRGRGSGRADAAAAFAGPGSLQRFTLKEEQLPMAQLRANRALSDDGASIGSLPASLEQFLTLGSPGSPSSLGSPDSPCSPRARAGSPHATSPAGAEAALRDTPPKAADSESSPGGDSTAPSANKVLLEVASDEPVLRPSHDGHHWRRYGRKIIKDADYPRLYYKCMDESCEAKKQMQVVRKETAAAASGARPRWITAVSYENSHSANCTRKCTRMGAQQAAKGRGAASRAAAKGLSLSPLSRGEWLARAADLAAPSPTNASGQPLVLTPRSAWAKALLRQTSPGSAQRSPGSVQPSQVKKGEREASGDDTGPLASKRSQDEAGGMPGKRARDSASEGKKGNDVRAGSEPSPGGSWSLGLSLGSTPRKEDAPCVRSSEDAEKGKSLRLFGRDVQLA